MLKQRGYLVAGLAVALALASITTLTLWKFLDTARTNLAKEKGAYTQFKEGVKIAGEKAEKDNADTLLKQKETHDAVVKNWTTRYAAFGIKYDRLRNAGANTSSGSLPAVPDAASSVNGIARDQRLLDVLQHAEANTLKLVTLQEWIAANLQRTAP